MYMYMYIYVCIYIYNNHKTLISHHGNIEIDKL